MSELVRGVRERSSREEFERGVRERNLPGHWLYVREFTTQGFAMRAVRRAYSGPGLFCRIRPQGVGFGVNDEGTNTQL